MSAYTPPAVYERTAAVVRVVDGDTLHLATDLGCDTTLAMVVRLYGVNAPETSTPEGRVARQFTTDWCAAHGPAFYVRTVRDRREKYGRWLVDLLPCTGGDSLCTALLAAGHAVYYLP